MMADLSEVELPTRFVFIILSPEDEGPGAIWEISEVGRSVGSMLGDQVRDEITYTYRLQHGLECIVRL